MKLLLSALLLLALLTPLATSFAEETAPAQPAAATLEKPPAPLSPIEPKYPKAALEEGLEGLVQLEVVISADGKTKSARVKESVRPDLDKAAIKAVKAVTWSPALNAEGKPVATTVVVPVRFKIAEKTR